MAAPKMAFYDSLPQQQDATEQVLTGLTARDKTIAPKFFYDEKGSELFTAITRLPEYYPTRTEIGLLRDHGDAIARCVGEDCLLIEYGSGSSEKIRVLLDAIRPRIYAPLDISRDYLAASAGQIADDYPWLEVRATCIDFSGDVDLPFELDARPVGFFPGSSIGNFERAAAAGFLRNVRSLVGDEGGLLIGVDLKKDHKVLDAAYNDAAGITARFNLNALVHLNTSFGANFDPSRFAHRAAYNETQGCIQMFLVSEVAQDVEVAGEVIHFAAGEEIHTENSHKYSIDEFVAMAEGAGFQSHVCWQDGKGWFAEIFLS